jgi:thiamine-phosphate pyrophosphorylase
VHPVVYMITDRQRLGERAGAALVRRVAAAARAGMHLIQIRERDMSDGELLTLVMQAVEAVRGTRTRILVNDRVDVAMVAGAHGVHLRADSAPCSARTQSGAAIVSDWAFCAHARRDLAGPR